jgi:hemerythrin-like metal-binding protein
MPIIWEDIYNTGIKEIDEQHKKLIALLSKLLDLVQDEKILKESKELKTVLSELINYTNYHFKTEEKYFTDFSYEDTKEHIEKHHEFRGKIMKISQEYHDNELEASYDLIEFLEHWFIDHINGRDKRYVNLLKNNGIK